MHYDAHCPGITGHQSVEREKIKTFNTDCAAGISLSLFTGLQEEQRKMDIQFIVQITIKCQSAEENNNYCSSMTTIHKTSHF